MLLSKLAGAMKAKQSQAAALFAAPLAKTARALGALQTKLEAGQPAAAPVPADEAPAEADASVVAPEATDVDAPAETATEETPETAAEAAVEETTEG